MKKTLLYVSPILSRSGYGDHAREFAKFLLTKKSEFDIKLAGTKWGINPQTALEEEPKLNKELSKFFISEDESFSGCDIYIQLGLPSEFKSIGKYNIGITAGAETDKVSSSFIDGANEMDLLIVPSEFTKETFLNSSYTDANKKEVNVNTPIVVVNEYADASYYEPTDSVIDIQEMSDIHESFCFLFVGQWIQTQQDDGGRKNIRSLINSFLSAFTDTENPPALVIKSHGANFSVSDYHNTYDKIKEIIQEHPSEVKPNIYLLHGDFTPNEMSDIYKHPKIKAFVTHTRGEGFGRPILEASLCGIPILATKWSGHLDIIDKKNSILLPGTLKQVGSESGPFSSNLFLETSSWMEVDNQYSADCMKRVFSEYEKYKQKADKLQKINLTKFSQSKIEETYNSVFSEYIPTE
jgi:glycosyltransferase involved in cell wall biosynthesis